MEEKYVIYGPEGWKLPQISLGEYTYNKLLQYKNVPVAMVSLVFFCHEPYFTNFVYS